MQFLDNQQRFFYQIFRIYGKDSSLVRENTFTASRTTASIPFCISKLCQKWTVTCNVQCSTSLNSIHLKACSKFPPHAFTQAQCLSMKLSMALLMIPLTARCTLIHQCPRLRMKCLVVFKRNSRDVTINRINDRPVWWPFIFANKFTVLGGTLSLCLQPTLLCQHAHRPAGKWNQMLGDNKSG